MPRAVGFRNNFISFSDVFFVYRKLPRGTLYSEFNAKTFCTKKKKPSTISASISAQSVCNENSIKYERINKIVTLSVKVQVYISNENIIAVAYEPFNDTVQRAVPLLIIMELVFLFSSYLW